VKHGDLVSVIDTRHGHRCHRLCVALNVTPRDISMGLNARVPGLYLFRGYWYGTDPLTPQSYGKIEGRHGKVIGRLRTHQQAKTLGL